MIHHRVANRYKQALEFSTPEARREYLEEHPNADPSKHTVKKPEGAKGTPGKLKSLSEKARRFLEAAPKAVKKFVEDSDHRKRALKSAGASLKQSPKKYVKRLLETAKHEVHEFKGAGEALAGIVKGKKPNEQQKKALRTVAIHMGITAAAAALTTTGVLAGAAFMGQATAKHVALKAAAKALGDLHMLEESRLVGTGLLDLMSKFADEKVSPEEAFSALVAKKVAEELENLSDSDMAEIMENAAKGSAKEASAWKVGAADDVKAVKQLLDKVIREVTALSTYAKSLDRAIQKAQKAADGLPSGWVWQKDIVAVIQDMDKYLKPLSKLDSDLEDFWLSHGGKLGEIANVARDATYEPPDHARLDHAISDLEFFPDPKTGREEIAYSVSTLKEWASALNKWVDKSLKMLAAEKRRAK